MKLNIFVHHILELQKLPDKTPAKCDNHLSDFVIKENFWYWWVATSRLL